MSAMLSFSERKTFARCFDKSIVARLRCLSDLLGVGGAARSLFPKNIGCNPHFSGALYMSALLSFSERKTFARCFEKSLAARLRCSSDLLGVGGAARSLFPKISGVTLIFRESCICPPCSVFPKEKHSPDVPANACNFLFFMI